MHISGNRFGGLSRPKSAATFRNTKSRPHPTISKGFGGSSTSLAPRSAKPMLRPSSSGIFKSQPRSRVPPTTFHMYYQRGDLPIAVNFYGATRKLVWKVKVDVLDYHHYLPIFFDGLRETREPHKFLCSSAIDDMLEHGPNKVLPVLP